jgi:pre-mRNA-processing factor 19
MFFCAISGEPPQDAVVSQKSGHVYERRLIIKYIEENGTEPITGDKLEESDLITIQASEFFFHVAAVVRMVLSNDDSFAQK